MVNFKIKDLDWTIKFFDPNTSTDEDLTELTCGRTSYVDNLINININMKESQIMRTIRHELTHAFRWTYGCVSEMELSNIPTSELEEVIANMIETFGDDIVFMTYDLYNKLSEELGEELDEE